MPMNQLEGKYFTDFFIEFEVPMKLVKLIKMCSNKTHCKVRIGKYMFPLVLASVQLRTFCFLIFCVKI